MSDEFENMSFDLKLSSAQLVIGSALGAYIGFSISREGVVEGSPIGLFTLLILLTVFVYITSLLAKVRYVRVANPSDLVRALLQITSVFVLGGWSMWQASLIGLNGEILFYLLVSWVLALNLDAWEKRRSSGKTKK